MTMTADIKEKGKGRAMENNGGVVSADAGPSAAQVTRQGIEDGSLTYGETVDAIVRFLEAAFHTILWMRGVYPPEIFQLRRIYSLPVHRSRHPGLNEYLTSLLTSLHLEITNNRLRRVIFVLTSASTGSALERYIFEVELLLPSVPRPADRSLAIKDNLTFRELETIFRGFLMKLSVLDASLEDLSPEVQEDLTWAVVVEMREEGVLPGPQIDKDQPPEGKWVPADDQGGMFEATRGGRSQSQSQSQTQSQAHSQSQSQSQTQSMELDGRSPSPLRARRRRDDSSKRAQEDDRIILPVKSLDSGVINLMLYVEDNPTSKSLLRHADLSTTDPTTPIRRQAHHHRHPQHSSTKKAKSKQGAPQALLDPAFDLASQIPRSRRGGGQGAEPQDLEDLLLTDALDPRLPHGAGDDGKRKRRKGIAKRRATTSGKDNGEDENDDEAQSDSSLSSSASSPSSGDSDGSQVSIASIGDFAGFGGAGAGRGGGGMTAGW